MLLSLTAGCSSSDSERTSVPADGGTVVLAPGEVAELPEGTLRYLRLVTDSRCPPDVQCVRAGDAAIELEWRPDSGASGTFRLHTGSDRERTIGDHQARLVELGRGEAPRATLRIEPAG